MKLCSTPQRSNNVVSPTDYEAIGNDVENGSSELPEENKTNSDEDNTAALSEVNEIRNCLLSSVIGII